MDNSEGLIGALPLAPTRWQVRVSTTVLPSNTGKRLTPKQNHLRLKTSLLLFLKGFEAGNPDLPQHQSFPAMPQCTGQGKNAFPLGCLDCLWPVKLANNSRTRSFKRSWQDLGMLLYVQKSPGADATLHLVRAQIPPAPIARARDASLALLSPA